jgi:hypothetical protein
LARVVLLGDGWYGFNLPAADVPDRLDALAQQCRRHGQTYEQLTRAVALSDGDPAMIPELAEAGVTELVVVSTPPADPDQADSWVQELAARWITPRRIRRPTAIPCP